MPFSRLHTALLASAFALAGTAHAAGETLISESFDSVSTLTSHGWVITNNSTPGGTTSWFQGDVSQFPSQDSAGIGYVAANFNSAPLGGTIDNWLITPEFSTAQAGHVTVWLRSQAPVDSNDDVQFADTVRFGFSAGGSGIGDFTTGSLVSVSGDWAQYSFAYAAGGAGSTERFAIEYTGSADASDYVGVDTLSIAAVPEPATWAMFAFGAMVLAARRRRSVR